MTEADKALCLFQPDGDINTAPDKDVFALMWYQNEDSRKNMAHLDVCAVEGFCYIRLLIFICDLANLPHDGFVAFAYRVMNKLGKNPLAGDVVTEIVSEAFLLLVGGEVPLE